MWIVKKILLDVVLCVFQTLDLDASFEATPLEESINTVGKSQLWDCGYATIDKIHRPVMTIAVDMGRKATKTKKTKTIDKSNFNKHMRAVLQHLAHMYVISAGNPLRVGLRCHCT